MTADGEVCQEAQAPSCLRCMGLGDGALALLRQLAPSGTNYLSTAVCWWFGGLVRSLLLLPFSHVRDAHVPSGIAGCGHSR